VSAAPSCDVRFGLWYDFRNPPAWPRPLESFYRESLDQIAWAEELGFDSIWVTEHHFVEDGYTPSPLVMLGAVAARTSRVRIGTNLMIPALHDPVRLAEDAATLAILSDGRFDLGVAAGYRELEFEAFGRRLRNRPSLLEESVEIMRRAWSGVPLAFEGKRFSYPGVRVHPIPDRPPRLLMGAHAEPALERVARLADGFLAPDVSFFDRYLDAHARVGRDPADARIFICDWHIIAADPEATWAEIDQHALYQLNQYIEWGAWGPPDAVAPMRDGDDVLARSAYRLFDAAGAVEDLVRMLERWPQIQDISFWAQLPGESVQSGSRRAQYIATEVLPQVRKRIGMRIK
jgi:alkanesulfonate monooxygenase SsuD/methylene tetrahydromethanopterin reductase-like flavin-dependent oxidoreductase (luciferase family)